MSEEVFRSPRKRGRIAVLLSVRGSNFLAIEQDARSASRMQGRMGDLLKTQGSRCQQGLQITLHIVEIDLAATAHKQTKGEVLLRAFEYWYRREGASVVTAAARA